MAPVRPSKRPSMRLSGAPMTMMKMRKRTARRLTSNVNIRLLQASSLFSDARQAVVSAKRLDRTSFRRNLHSSIRICIPACPLSWPPARSLCIDCRSLAEAGESREANGDREREREAKFSAGEANEPIRAEKAIESRSRSARRGESSSRPVAARITLMISKAQLVDIH